MMTTLWLVLWLVASQARPATIEGRVVLADDSVPLVNEAVGLWPLGRVVRTDAAGRFIFRNVPRGQFTLIVIHDRIKATVSVTLGDRQGIEGVLIVVNPAPAITGAVFDPFGQRLASARVDAFRTIYRPTGANLQLVKTAMSNDLGEFRLFRLPPGSYYVSASYSDRDQRSGGAAYRWSPNVSRADDGFSTLYFGDAYRASQSQRIDLGFGDRSGTGIFLREGPRYSVSGRMVGPDGDVCAQIAIVPEGGVLDSEKDFSTGACGRFTVKGLSPGLYFLFAVGKGFASDAVGINIPDRDVEDITVPMERTITLRGRATIDGVPSSTSNPSPAPPARGRGPVNSPRPQTRRVVLSRSSIEITQKLEGVIEADGRFEIPEVGPGFFDVFVDPLSEGIFVRSIQQGVLNLLLGPSELSKNVGTLNIQLSRRSATAEGVALDKMDRPVPDAQVVLVPTTLRNREDRYYSVYADPGGNFKISGIAPGTYIMYAFEDLDPGAYFAIAYDDGARNRWLPRGRSMDFSDGSASEPLKLSIIPAAETIGGALR